MSLELLKHQVHSLQRLRATTSEMKMSKENMSTASGAQKNALVVARGIQRPLVTLIYHV